MMGAYVAIIDLEVALGSAGLSALADRDNDGVADANLLEQTLASVNSLIDGYLRGRYALPIMTVPEVLRGLAVDLAVYNLNRDGTGAEEARIKAQSAMSQLKRIAEGQLLLDVPMVTASGSVSAVHITSNERERDAAGFKDW